MIRVSTAPARAAVFAAALTLAAVADVFTAASDAARRLAR